MEKNMATDFFSFFEKKISLNRYGLTIGEYNTGLSVLSIKGHSILNKPWHYEVIFTSRYTSLLSHSILSQSAMLSFIPKADFYPNKGMMAYSDQNNVVRYYGVITEFDQLFTSADETHYRVVLSSRLALLGLHRGSQIYQNKSVIEVAKEVLRRHGFQGMDYALHLKDTYPAREFIAQWQESDLDFLQRILSDVGVWMRFESNIEHSCDVVVLSDNETGLSTAAPLRYQEPSGMQDGGTFSVWDLSQRSKTTPEVVQLLDYNYRDAHADMQGETSSSGNDAAAHGVEYRYGEHYKTLGSENEIESGMWYARLRHQQHMSEQTVIAGRSNQYTLRAGQHLMVEGHPLGNMLDEGVIIVSVRGLGERKKSYEVEFTAIPYNPEKPYRPPLLDWPIVAGTLPGRVTSAGNDTYGFVDVKGRYRVKLGFDLKEWESGQESLWLRLAKPYAGSQYGFHFPLLEGTEVAIGFTGGNPDRPYIAYALHDSSTPDPVSLANKHQNVIRTAANNTLRMDDKRGEEHIKLSTDYGETQLNLGHLVDDKKGKRGMGFELRTDEWGTIAAGKGLYLTTETEPKAAGKQLDMQGLVRQLEKALSLAKSLQTAAGSAHADTPDVVGQKKLKDALTSLSQSSIGCFAEAGACLVSPADIQVSAGHNVTITSEHQTDISALKKITVAAGDALSLFAQKMGIKLLANQGKVDIQAQNDAMSITAQKGITIESSEGHVTLRASESILLPCGGSYIKIGSSGIELGSANNVTLKCAAVQKMGPATQTPEVTQLPSPITDHGLTFLCEDNEGKPYIEEPYIATLSDGRSVSGITDQQGRTDPIYDLNPGNITIKMVNIEEPET